MSSLIKAFSPSPSLRPMYNLGCLLDLQTGRYYTGKHGESILNGGLSYITGVSGRGNVFKTVVMFFQLLRVLDRYFKSTGLVYDTEVSASMGRLYELAANMEYIGGVDLEESGRLRLTDKTIYSGNAFYDILKSTVVARADNTKNEMGTTPFIDTNGQPVKAFFPFVSAVDSFSQFTTDSVLKIQDKADIGESERNVEALRDAHAKNQMMMELPTVTAKYGMQIMLSAHMGDDLQMDPYAPPQKKLAFLKNKLKLKNVPEKFTFLTNNCWFMMSSEVMVNQTTKAPEFPADSDDNIKGDTDLQLITCMSIRNKSGPTGLTFELIVSQNEGVMVGLTEFYYIRKYERYGLGGNDRNYFLHLMPDVSLSRTTIRGKLNDNLQLQRAMEITSEMCQMINLDFEIPKECLCTPEQLYTDLKAQGYDWNVLLNTRGYWTFEEDNHPKHFLSTMDLLNMRAGKYFPYWMNPDKTIKAEYKKG